MKKAESIEEIYQVFAPEKYLQKGDKEFYVNLYPSKIKEFVTALKYNQNNTKTFFIAGQSGNGKSTVLNLLTSNYPIIEEKYNVHTIAGRAIFLYEDIDIVDILLMIGNLLTQQDEALKEIFFDKLKKLEEVNDGVLEESENTLKKSSKEASVKASIGVGAKFLSILHAGIDFASSYKINEEIRTDARKFFKIKRKELIDLTNEIIFEYKKNKNDDKELIIIIDDLEKKDNIDTLFLKDMPLLNELNIVKIITMPIYLYRGETFPSADVREFGLKLKTFDREEFIEDKAILKEVILKRLANKSLIDAEAITMAIEYSGANLRQLIKLVHFSAEKALSLESDKITAYEMQSAIDTLSLAYSSKVNNMKTFLSEIQEKGNYEDKEENLKHIAKATKMELVFAYFNGIEWYELNPIVIKSLKAYTTVR